MFTKNRLISRVLTATVLFMFLVLIAGVLLVSLGIFDPKPVGQLARRLDFGVEESIGEEELLMWLADDPGASSFSTRMTARWLSGELDSGFGMVIGEQIDYIVIAISPLGYLSIWKAAEQGDVEKMESIVPWKPWPHIAGERSQNEIWIDVQNDVVVNIWINRERVAVEPIALPGRQIGAWSQSYGQPAEIRIDSIEIFAEAE